MAYDKYSDRHSMLPRVLSLDTRVKNSELFPRIRDAEREMIQNEKDFQRQQYAKKKKRMRRQAKDTKLAIEESIKHPSTVEKIDDYFMKYSLNKDPRCSKYMPYNEVFFPKLFNLASTHVSPDAIGSLWMLAFQDHEARKEAAQMEAEAHLIHKPTEKERRKKNALSPESIRSAKTDRFNMYKT